MRKPRQFRPTVADTRLEERVVLSVTALQSQQALLGLGARPRVTSGEVNAALNQIHAALRSYSASTTNAILFAQSQVNAGTISAATAANLLEAYIGNKTSLLFFQTRAATSRLPYGAGFNGYVNPSFTDLGDLPSGADSLYSQLTFPSSGAVGPIAALQNNVFTALSAPGIPGAIPTPDFAGALNAVNPAAIGSAFAQVRTIVGSYVVNGIRAHDFRS